MACVQDEERARVNQFVFADDVVLSLVKGLTARKGHVFTLCELRWGG